VEDLARWIAESGLKSEDPFFTVPRDLRKILDRDLKMAGIPKRDARGRTLDVHALRTTFGTLPSVGGVAPRTAQSAMRHSDLKLTMNTYTDPKLLDVAGAIYALLLLPLPSPLALPLAPTPVPVEQTRSNRVNDLAGVREFDRRQSCDGSALPVNERSPLSEVDNGLRRVGLAGFEPTTSCTPSRRASQAAPQPE
jgi:hypothetical protein